MVLQFQQWVSATSCKGVWMNNNPAARIEKEA